MLVGCSAVLAVGVTACGGGSHSAARTSKLSASTAPVTTGTTTTRAKHAARHPRSKRSKTTVDTHTTATSTTHTTPTHHPKTHTTTKPAPSTTTKSTPSTPSSPTYTRPLRATLVGQNHDPTASKLWSYTVTATDANGRPLPGTVDTEFTFDGVVVGHESPPTHRLTDGRLHDKVTFPPDAEGHPIHLQVVVHTPIGSVTLDWSVVTRAK